MKEIERGIGCVKQITCCIRDEKIPDLEDKINDLADKQHDILDKLDDIIELLQGG